MQSEGSFNSGRKSLPERNKDWVEHDVDLNKFQQLTPEYLKLNPNGVVPTLVHDGQPLIESSALLEYLEEIIPEPSLVPADSIGRAKMRAWMRYIDEVPTVAVRVPTFANIIAPMRFAKTTDTDFSKHADRLPLRKQFYQRMTQKGFGKEEVEYASNCAAPIHHKAGEIRPETQGTSHWWKNLSDNPVVLFIGDVRSDPNDHHM